MSSDDDQILHLPGLVDDTNRAELLQNVQQKVVDFLTSASLLSQSSSPTITVKQLSSATTNLGFRIGVKFTMEQQEENLYFMRIFGNGTEVLYCRKRELEVMKVASRWKIGPQIHATFDNGIISEFLRGRELETHEVRTAERSAQIAREVARWHKLDTQHLFSSDVQALLSEDSITMLYRWMSTAESLFEKHPDAAVSQAWRLKWSELHGEIDDLTYTLKRLLNSEEDGGVPRLVFSHNDLNPGNIMVMDSEHRLVFIDVETASLNYHPFDLGNFCNEWCGVLTTDWNHFPSEAQQRAFIWEYLHELHGRDPTDHETQLLWKEVHYFSLFSNLFWCVWAIIQAFHSHITHFSHLDYAQMRWQRYLHIKHTFEILPSPILVRHHKK